MTDTLFTPNAARVAGSTPVLAIQDLSVSFRGRSVENQALKGISFAIHPGEIVAVVGESGSGKSVTSLAVMGLLAASGRIDRDCLFHHAHRHQYSNGSGPQLYWPRPRAGRTGVGEYSGDEPQHDDGRLVACQRIPWSGNIYYRAGV